MLLFPLFVLLLAKLAFADTPSKSKEDFDIYQGPSVQSQHQDDPAYDETFTLTGGQPSVEP
jgi:hypothetical protein